MRVVGKLGVGAELAWGNDLCYDNDAAWAVFIKKKYVQTEREIMRQQLYLSKS